MITTMTMTTVTYWQNTSMAMMTAMNKMMTKTIISMTLNDNDVEDDNDDGKGDEYNNGGECDDYSDTLFLR